MPNPPVEGNATIACPVNALNPVVFIEVLKVLVIELKSSVFENSIFK
ncbi:MAG: hypothetical protein IKP65_00010 [Alphaproteobacteria bacterium]|nr:hypothetical protein [Alphaproteobacteria bacterium]